ncbi:hypothetical protein [Loktanella sp. SALINAS62]|uniref:hypothetical protein n=1 Tax=Loktanella sp. SALINAS62 TaxID=2706124 RepID=UPI001B8AFF3D|nr:hypothetical protein [Loktanella sp. SALINAS62]MBS1304275.1 hypothetical protein [Loktanella sp. SALINAS62]
MTVQGEGGPFPDGADRWTDLGVCGLLLAANIPGGPPQAAGAAPPCHPDAGDAPGA